MRGKVKKLIGHYKLSSEGDELLKCNAMIRHVFPGVEPEQLEEKAWAQRVAEAMWIEEQKIERLKGLGGIK